MFLLAFPILSLLELSVDTTTFVDYFLSVFIGVIVGDLSQVFSLLTSTTLFKSLLQVLLLGELDFRFCFDDSRIRAITECEHWASDFSFSDIVLIMAVFIWFSALRYLTSSFRGSTRSQSQIDRCLSSRDFFTTIFAQGRRISMPIFQNLTVWSDP